MITSRNPGWHDLASPVEVDVFDRNESITLLHRRAPQLAESETGQVAEALGDLPLALAQVVTDLLAQGAPTTYPFSLAASAQIAIDRLTALFTTHLPDPLAAAATVRSRSPS